MNQFADKQVNYNLERFNPESLSHMESSVALLKSIWGDTDFSHMDYAKWQYIQNPFGRVEGYLAFSPDNQLASQYVAIGSQLWDPHLQRKIRALLSVNTATNASHRGRGLFNLTAKATYKTARESNWLAVYGFPNDQSLPGFKKLGFSQLPKLEMRVKPIGIFRIIKALPGILQQWRQPKIGDVSSSLEKATKFTGSYELPTSTKDLIHIPRTKEWLDWRYADHPTRRYHILKTSDSLFIVRLISVADCRIALLMDVMGSPKVNDWRELYSDLKSDSISALISVNTPSFSDVFDTASISGWIKVPNFIAPKSFYTIIYPMDDSVSINYQPYFTLGDIDIF